MASNSVQRWTKKPVTVEVVLWDETRETFELLKATGMEYGDFYSHVSENYVRNLRIRTLEGPMLASKGDYIIKGVKNEFYPCKPDIFAMTYSPAVPVVHGQPKWFFSHFRTHPEGARVGCIVDDQQDLIIAEVYELEGVNNGPLMARAPELLALLKEATEASAACFRVIFEAGLVGELEAEFLKSGVVNGFGLRAKDAIAKAEATHAKS